MSEHTRRIAVAQPIFLGNERKYVLECLDTSWISSVGRFIPEFEASFARFCNVPHAVACDTGTSALHLALLGLGIGAGDEVILPTLTFVATANAVRYCGAQPVLVDSEPRTLNIDPTKIEERITPNTKAIIVVHLYGHPADMTAVLDIARRRGLFVIEDAAEAHGGLHCGRPVGSLGDIGTFSFFGNKIVTTGEGGMITTSDPALAKRIIQLRGQGMDPERRYWFPIVGYNYRMTNIQAAIGLAQMENIELHLKLRRQVAGWYRKYLSPLQEWLQLPAEEEWARHAFWMYTVVLHGAGQDQRDQVMALLSARGIETRPIFYPMHLMPPYASCRHSMPVAESLAGGGISLPTHGQLTEDDVRYVSHALGEVCLNEMRDRTLPETPPRSSTALAHSANTSVFRAD